MRENFDERDRNIEMKITSTSHCDLPAYVIKDAIDPFYFIEYLCFRFNRYCQKGVRTLINFFLVLCQHIFSHI